MNRLYVPLAVLFAVAVAGQVTYTIDVFLDMRGDYPMKPFTLADPWPTIARLDRSGQRAGLRVGDRVTAIDGRLVNGQADVAVAVRSRRPGDTLAVTAVRGGETTDYRVAIEGNRGHPDWYFTSIAWLLMPSLSIALGFWVAGARPHDPRAWCTLGVLLGMSRLTLAGILDPLGWPAPLGLAIQVFRDLSSPVWVVSMMLFGIYFPQRWALDRRLPWLKWLLGAVVGIPPLLEILNAAVEAVNYPAAAYIPKPALPPGVAFALDCIAIGIFFAGLANKYHYPGLAADDRRRLRLLYWGCSAAMTPLFLLMLYDLIILHRSAGDADGYRLLIAMMALVLFPLTMAYVIVVERAMDVRVVIRQGVQYALARRGIKVIQGGMIFGLVFPSGQLMVASAMSRPARFTLIAVGIVVALRIRDLGERLRRWLDRRFFREAYKSEQILGELGEQVRTILDSHALLETVARKIGESLHVERIAVMLRDGGAFRPALATGYPARLDISVAPDAPPLDRMARSREPVQVHGELAELGAQLLLPLGSRKELLGFISLGPKRSEEPYSPSDESLLRSVATQTGLALENSRLSEAIANEVAQRETLNREIEIAREVQQRLFPQNMPEVAALEYAGHCRPARGVGGDYYDFLALASGRLGLAIADVSGKGIPAALLMASLQASVRGQSQSGTGHVAELMANVNRLVCDASPENRYATFFYGQFDPATRRLVYTNGGHNPPIVLRGAEVLRLENGGPPVGLFRFSRYEQDEIELLPGDLLVLFTDGISEAENPTEDEWGEDALIATARACVGLPAAETIARVMAAADAFAAGAPQHDDMTVVVARVLPD